MDSLTRDRTLRLAGVETRNFDPHQLRDPGGQDGGQWVSTGGALKDVLKLADRIKLGDGETLVGSDKLQTDHATVRIAAVDRGGKRSLRLGIGDDVFGGRQDEAGPWRAGPDETAKINADRSRLFAEFSALGASGRDLTKQEQARYDELDNMDLNDVYPSGYTAALDASAVGRLRTALGDALTAGAEVDRLHHRQDELRAIGLPSGAKLGRKWTPAEDAEWDAIEARLKELEGDRNYIVLAEGSVPGEWADVHYNVYHDDGQVWVDLGAVPPGLALTDLTGSESAASLDAAETAKLIRLLDKMVPGEQRSADLPAEVRHRALSLLGIEVRDVPDDTPDEDTAALVAAIRSLAGDEYRNWTPAQEEMHPRGPGGKFRKLTAGLAAALHDFLKGDGPSNPLDKFNREQVRRAAKELEKDGMPAMRRGATEPEIKAAILDHVRQSFREVAAADKAAPKVDGKFTLKGKAHRNKDVAVFHEPDGKVSLYEESGSGARGARVVTVDNLAGLEKWANDNGETELADWARSEGGTPAVPAKKAAPTQPASTAPKRLRDVVTGDVVIWEAPGEVPTLGRVTREPGKGVKVDWSGGRREHITTYRLPKETDVRVATPEEIDRLGPIQPTIDGPAAPRKAVPKGDLTGANGLSSDPAVRDVQVENRIREAYRAAYKDAHGATPDMYVGLAAIREHLGESMSRKDVDAALMRMAVESGGRRDGSVQIVPVENSRALTQADRDSALRMGGEDHHAIKILDPSPRPLPTTDQPSAPAKAVKKAAPAAKSAPVVDAAAHQAAKADLAARLTNLGRRTPADPAPLDRAAQSLAGGATPADVAKQLRADSKALPKEDGDTLRYLAADLTSKKAVRPPYLGPDNSVDLQRFSQHIGADITPYLDPKRDGMPFVWAPLEEQFPYSYGLYQIVDGLANGTMSTRKAIATLRKDADIVERVAGFRQRDIDAAKHTPSPHDIAQAQQGPPLAAVLRKMADQLEAAKIPPRKRGVSLGGTTLAEAVPVDETRFVSRPLKGGLLQHRGKAVPDAFRHAGNGTSLALARTSQQRPGLTDAENRALDLYTVGAVADRLNGSLRQGRNAHGSVKAGPIGQVDVDEVQRGLESALHGSELTQDAVLWRGSLAKTADLRRLVPGAIYADAGYLSTSTDEKGARETIRWRMGQGVPAGRKPVVFKILAPAGTHAALGHERVSEALLPKGQQFRVVRVDESGDMPVVVMEVVPPAVDSNYLRGRQLLDEFDFNSVDMRPTTDGLRAVVGDRWLADIQREQGFNGPPEAVSSGSLDTAVADGAIELWRGFRDPDDGSSTAGQLLEEYRSGMLFSGNPGAYGSGTYAGNVRSTAESYGTAVLRMALRRDARVVKYDELVKLQTAANKSKAGADLDRLQRDALAAVDPSDVQAVAKIQQEFEDARSRLGARARIMGDLGRFAALLGYDAMYVPAGQAGKKSGQPAEYVIVNRTAVLVQEA